MKFTKEQLNAVAAMFARTNIGMAAPTADELKRAASPHLSNSVVSLCEQFMETDEHEEIFYMEAKGWLKNKHIKTLESIAAHWPSHAAIIQQAFQVQP